MTQPSETTPSADVVSASPQPAFGHAVPRYGCWVVIILAVFLLRLHSWMSSELWYDEVLTIQRFISRHQQNLSGIFTDYPIANNHILATFLHAWWMSLTGNIMVEYVIRFPALLCGLGTLLLVLLHWRRALGGRVALFGGTLLAVSPVFTAYAYQLRGYSLTMFLVTLAISGILELGEKHRGRGIIMVCAASALLPLVMPSNLMIAPVLCALCLSYLWYRGAPLRSAILAVMLCGFSFVFGGSYYLTIFQQFHKAMSEPDGWPSAWAVAGNLLLGVLAHGVVLLALIRGNLTLRGKLLLANALVLILTVCLVLTVGRSGHAPFPRVFLVMLPAVTFLLLQAVRDSVAVARINPSYIAVAILVNGILWERVGEGVTDWQLRRGTIPDNLLQQYYRGAVDLREVALLKEMQDNHTTAVMADAYDIMSFRFYRGIGTVEQPLISIGVNEVPQDFWKTMPPNWATRLIVVAKSPESAAEMFAKAGLGEKERLVKRVQLHYRTQSGRRGVYVLD